MTAKTDETTDMDTDLYPMIRRHDADAQQDFIFSVQPGSTVEMIQRNFPKHVLLGGADRKPIKDKSIKLLAGVTYDLVPKPIGCLDSLINSLLCMCDD